MPCYHPVKAFQCADGSVVFSDSFRRHDIRRCLDLPCGQCVGCRLERSRQWALRCLHESKMHKRNCFVTLTYDDAHLPSDLSLDYRHFQLFMKRLRREKGKVRFYMCGEYGEKLGRPHYHALLFGIDFDDKVVISGGKGYKLYRSATLERLWPYGFSSIGEVTFKSAAYCARYIMKKVTGDAAKSHYSGLDLATGEVVSRTPEFNHMSLKPGIGATFADKFRSDVYPSDQCVVNGKPSKPPRYYDNRLKKVDPDLHEEILYKRELDMRKRYEDNTNSRLQVKEQVTKARVEMYKRNKL
ncbi:MAG: replication initiator protein [Microviridae sp.]|nr:MAG: replication initiator protein [Microviridae sp.]